MGIKPNWRISKSLSPSLSFFFPCFFQTVSLQKQLKKQWLKGSWSRTYYCQLIVFTWTEAITLIYGVSNKYVKNKKVLKKKVEHGLKIFCHLSTVIRSCPLEPAGSTLQWPWLTLNEQLETAVAAYLWLWGFKTVQANPMFNWNIFTLWVSAVKNMPKLHPN